MRNRDYATKSAACLIMAALTYGSLPALGQVVAERAASEARFVDVLETPALKSPLAQHTLMLATAHSGKRLVAVGLRGHILSSSDAGATWVQGNVPVSSDLTAVWMANESKAWAVGHDGVILHSADGGLNWSLQLDGRRAMPRILASLESNTGGDKSGTRQKLLDEAARYGKEGPDKPFLGVWFADENNGFVVGAYNLIFNTRDGGKTWESWFDRTDNPEFLHFNAIHGDGGNIVIVGEKGLVLKFDPASRRFVSLQSPYNGSFFDVKTWNGEILAVGMRGNAWRHAAGKWEQIEVPLKVGLSGVALMPDGRIVIASQAGKLLVGRNGGKFEPVTGAKPMVYSGVADAGPDKVALTGNLGIRIETLK